MSHSTFPPKRILLTGFEPFDGEKINPSWEAVKLLEGELLIDDAGLSYQIDTRQLACVFKLALTELYQAMNELCPAVTLCVGQAGGRGELSLERIGINIDDARIADNQGNQPIDAPIMTSGPAAYFSNLPIKAMTQAINAQGIAASISNTAGTFVCNHTFYGLMHYLATEPKHALGRGGFMHIPYLPEQVSNNQPSSPSMPLADMVKGIRLALMQAINLQRDIHVTAGREF